MADFSSRRFCTFALIIQAIFVIIFGVFCRYGDQMEGKEEKANIMDIYPMFQDVHTMIFIGFGFLMTFLKFYGFSSVGLNMLISALVIQWSLIINGMFHLENGKFYLTMKSLLSADFSCAAILISFGALLGRISPTQCLILSMIEVPIFIANEYVGLNKFMAADMGGSMFVHIFGAYFGLAAAKTLAKKSDAENANEKSSHNSDQFAMIGTLFLWLYWPSFNSALAEGDCRMRAVTNTYLALAACAVSAFAASSVVEEGKFEMSHVQNATLAGGVAVGTVADMIIQPWAALGIGCLAGIVSVIGYRFLSPKLKENGFLDTCGVNNLHGMPGILSALFGILYSGLASKDEYGDSLTRIFPARNASSVAAAAAGDSTGGRSAGMQAAFQAAACSLTLLCALIGGALTGFVLRLSVFDRRCQQNFYLDSANWQVPDDFVPPGAVVDLAEEEAEEAADDKELSAV